MPVWEPVLEMDVTELTDVIARAQARDPAAFDVLVERYSSRLYGYFYRATGRRADSEDLLQELFVRLVGTISQYKHDGRFDAWLFRIATNLIRDRIRRSRSSREVPQSSAVEADERWERNGRGTEVTQPADRLGETEELDRLGRAIQELPEPERMVILLRHFSQMSFREIAELMETPLGTALARAHRGLARLRELMTTEADGRRPAAKVD
jgi:RNA polymerase sigma-70 factor, ECF subfamily